MSIFDVHIKRAPVSGTVVSVQYHPGKFMAANVEKASLANEQNGVLLETPDGRRIAYVKIAGIIAGASCVTSYPGTTSGRGRAS